VCHGKNAAFGVLSASIKVPCRELPHRCEIFRGGEWRRRGVADPACVSGTA
jgi:hypothetical protein